MAIVTIPDENRTIQDLNEAADYLATIGIDYERWEPGHQVADGAAAEDVLAAYAREIESLKARGGYVTADVIDVNANTQGLEAMLAKFNREHWHDEDEVRFIIEGRGLFHIHPRGGRVAAIEVEAGDLIRVPRGTWHWFNLCGDRRIRAIRLFQDMAGWTPKYTESGKDAGYQPMCLGASYFPAQPQYRAKQ
ncbi:MAG TPA: cupin domain-containing protein [Blastocatellia bacterium]|nr:cupin domain-containing protein [Blastocatellia bacterium]